MPTIANPSHSWTTSPVKVTVCKAQTEISRATSSQKVAFSRHFAGFAQQGIGDFHGGLHGTRPYGDRHMGTHVIGRVLKWGKSGSRRLVPLTARWRRAGTCTNPNRSGLGLRITRPPMLRAARPRRYVLRRLLGRRLAL